MKKSPIREILKTLAMVCFLFFWAEMVLAQNVDDGKPILVRSPENCRIVTWVQVGTPAGPPSWINVTNGSFNAWATGRQPINYQWYLKGQKILGATGSVLPISAGFDPGPYYVIVSNELGQVASREVWASVCNDSSLNLVNPPGDQTVYEGDSVAVQMEFCGGSVSFTRRTMPVWRKDGVVFVPPGNTSPFADSLVITNATWRDSAVYRYEWGYSHGLQGSILPPNYYFFTNQFVLRVIKNAPQFIEHPYGKTVNSGEVIVLTTKASGRPPLFYQWRRNGINISGATNSMLTIDQVQATDAGYYTVEVSNSVGAETSSTALISINKPPTFVDLQPVSVAEQGNLSVQLKTADSDLPAQQLTVRLVSGPPGLTVSSQGLVSWAPTEAQGGFSYPVALEVSDGSLTTSGQFEVTVAEVNRPPFINQVAAGSVVEGTAWTQALVAVDPDLPANHLTFRLINGPSGASVDSQTGVLSWVPSEMDGGSTVSLVVEAVDDGQPPLAYQTTVQLTVTEVNNNPTLADLADVAVLEGVAWSITVRATDSDLPQQALNYQLKSGPAGMTLNATTGELRWTPSESQGPEEYRVIVSVTDAAGASVERSFTVNVTEVNQPPQVASWADQRIVFGQSVTLQMDVTDTDLPANRLIYRLVGGPTNLVFGDDGRLVWTPNRSQAPSTNQISVAVSDGTVGVTNSVTIEVFELVMAVNGSEVTEAVNASLDARISFRCGRSDWLVYYSLNGQTPTYDLPSKFYQDPFVLPVTSTVWPIAFSPDFSESVRGIPVRVAVQKDQNLSLEGGFGLIHLGPGVEVTARSTSGLPVSVSVVSGPATLVGGKLIPSGGGVVRLRVSQAGDENWSPAQADFERTVARARQTVEWQPVGSLVYGSEPMALKANATSGLPLEYSVVSGPGFISGDRLQVTAVGAVVIRAHQSGTANFEAASADWTVLVAKASQSIVWSGSPDRTYSPEPILLTATASSGLALSYAVVSGPALLANDRLTLTGVGTVVIRASQPGNANYEAAAQEVSWVISKIPHMLVFEPIGPRTFGEGPVALSAISEYGLPVTYRVRSGPGSIAGNQLSLTGAGDLVVEASQAGSELYQSVAVAQTVTVAKASQVLTWLAETTLTYRTNLLSLVAKASSGLLVNYRIVSGPGALVSGQLNLTGVGALVIAAEQPGDGNWLAATAVTNRFTVGRGVQTVAFDPVGDQTLGTGPVTLMARASSGLPVTFSVISGPAVVNDQQLTLSGEGVVTVRAINPGSPLWLAASADQTFTVKSGGGGDQRPQVAIVPPKQGGSFGLEIRAPQGATVAVETTGDLTTWTETQRVTGQGSGTPVKVTLQADPNVQAKFWRVRVR
jgi:hypothetical protein